MSELILFLIVKLVALAGLLLLIALPLAAIVFFGLALANLLPEISLAWALRMGLNRGNFTERGLRFRRWAGRSMVVWLVAIVMLIIIGTNPTLKNYATSRPATNKAS